MNNLQYTEYMLAIIEDSDAWSFYHNEDWKAHTGDSVVGCITTTIDDVHDLDLELTSDAIY